MKILAETHTHTNACSHAYHSVQEMVDEAARRGMELIAITDHAPAIPDAPHEWHFVNLKALPHKIGDIYVLGGTEANIIDMEGGLDLAETTLKKLDLVITSIHSPCLAPGTVEQHTNTYLKVLQNPYVDIIGHCGSPDYSFDIDAVLEEAKRQDKIIELNSHTFAVRKASAANCFKIAKRCAELGVKVVLSTDAHSMYEIGHTEAAQKLAKEAGIKEELIMNTTAEKFLSYLCQRKGLDRAAFEHKIPTELLSIV